MEAEKLAMPEGTVSFNSPKLAGVFQQKSRARDIQCGICVAVCPMEVLKF
jgi:ferredoxin